LYPARFDGVDVAEQLGGELDPAGAGALKATVFSGEAFEAGLFGSGHGVELGLTVFTAAEDPGGVRLAVGAMTGGFPTFGAQSVKRSRDHGEGELEAVKEATEAAEIGPEVLAESGEGGHYFI
jgi:hypothetical protein